jgi:hypothetical protein
MDSERIRILAIVVGLFLSILGLFLPWAKEESGPWFMAGQGYLLGVLLLLGTMALISNIAAAIFLVLHVKRKQRYWLVPVLLDGLTASFCSLAWISNPDVLGWHWDWLQEYGLVLSITSMYSYKVLYGAYISLAGSITTLVGAILNLLHR